MPKKIRPFNGSAVALITPFNADLSVDYESLERLIEYQIEAGTDAILVLGTTGESPTLSDEEKYSITEFSAKAVNNRVPLIAGAGSNDTLHSAELAKNISNLGCDAILSVAPYYNKPTESGMINHFTKVADSSSCPVILYDVPQRTGVSLTLPVLRALSEHENIFGIKDAAGDITRTAELLSSLGDSLFVYCGNDSMTCASMSLGAHGVISVLANIMPYEVQLLCRELLNGHMPAGAKLQLKLMKIIKELFIESNPIPVKYACAELGLCQPTLRLPLSELTHADKAKVRSCMKEYGLL